MPQVLSFHNTPFVSVLVIMCALSRTIGKHETKDVLAVITSSRIEQHGQQTSSTDHEIIHHINKYNANYHFLLTLSK